MSVWRRGCSLVLADRWTWDIGHWLCALKAYPAVQMARELVQGEARHVWVLQQTDCHSVGVCVSLKRWPYSYTTSESACDGVAVFPDSLVGVLWNRQTAVGVCPPQAAWNRVSMHGQLRKLRITLAKPCHQSCNLKSGDKHCVIRSQYWLSVS